MRIAEGTLTALAGAGTDTTDNGAEKLSLDGDLSQMGQMGRALRSAGFDVRNSDVYPVIQGADNIKRALQFLWDRRIEGWWNQRSAMIRYGICTSEEFTKRLDEQCGH